jgi:hypothetical protein
LRAEHYNEQWISIKARNLLTSWVISFSRRTLHHGVS